MKDIKVIVGKERGDRGNKYFFCFTAEENVMDDGTVVPKETVITFSTKVWKGEIPPDPGQTAVLSNVRQFTKGLRANSARPISL